MRLNDFMKNMESCVTFMMINKIYQIDCIEGMRQIEDSSVDLIVTDPPYNIGKDDWDKIDYYEDWLMNIFKECERVLKKNGSFYFFHNEVPVIADLMNRIRSETNFTFKQFIVWNKRFDDASNKGYLDGFIEVGNLRNYQKMAEYILFYTFQDETGLNTAMLNINNFTTLRKYFKNLQEYIGLNINQINSKLGNRNGEHCFYWKTTQWCLPTMKTYQKLVDTFRIDKWRGFREYEDLRREYEDLRYTFNNQKTHHSVWNYEIAKKQGHLTPKPLDLMKNIIIHSSNEGDTVLDPFMGSGTTAVACKQLGRNFIGFEINSVYVEIAKERLSQETLDNR